MLEYKVEARRVDAHGALATTEVHAVRQDSPPKMVSIDYVLTVDTDESDQRLELLHRNVRKYGTISNTVAAATELYGIIRRQA